MLCFQNGEPSTSHSNNAQILALEKTIVDQHFKIIDLTKQNGTLDLSVRAFTDRLHSFNRVLDERDKEIAATYQKIEHLEEALRVKTLQWQELHAIFQNWEKAQQDSTRLLQEMEANVKGHKTKILLLQDKLVFEKKTTRALSEKVARLERRLEGKPEPEMTPEIRRYRMMEELRQIAEVFGEDSEEYKIKQKKLDRLLRAESAIPVAKDSQK